MAESRTEKPSARAVRLARERGDFPRSTELTGGLLIVACGLVLERGGEDFARHAEATFVRALALAHGPPDMLGHAVVEAIRGTGLLVLPLGSILVASAFFSAFAQNGRLAFRPWSRARSTPPPVPADRFERLLGMASSLLGGLTVVLAASLLSVDALTAVMTYAGNEPRALVHAGARVVPLFLVRAGILLALFGLALLVLRRLRHHARRKMTRSERKREIREMEGDPAVRRERIRRFRDASARPEQLVDELHVLLVAPGELAVGLRYDPASDPAPRVLLRVGAASWPRLEAAAARADVPVRFDRSMTVALASVDEGALVPSHLYEDLAALFAELSRERAA